MTYVVTRLCRDCKDYGCVSVCPTDCIVEHKPMNGVSGLPNQVFINPDDCITCGMCVPECPFEAIFEEDAVPEEFKYDVPLNALVRQHPHEFVVPEVPEKAKPTSALVTANWQKWGASP